MLKNLFVYQCAHPLALDYLNTDLERLKFIAPMPQSVESMGWSDTADAYVCSAMPYHLMLFRQDKKIIPKSAVDDAFNEKVGDDLEQLSAAEKKQIKEDVLMTLKPQALCRRQDVSVVWHHAMSQLWVGTSSISKADAVMEWVIQTWPGIKATPWLDRAVLRDLLTQSLRQQKWPEGVTTGHKVVLIHPNDAQKKVAIQGIDVDSEGTLHWLSQGFQVQQIQLIWQDKVQLTFSEQGFWSGIKDLTVNERLHDQEDEPMTREWMQCALVDELIQAWTPWLEEVKACQLTAAVS